MRSSMYLTEQIARGRVEWSGHWDAAEWACIDGQQQLPWQLWSWRAWSTCHIGSSGSKTLPV